MIAVVERDVLDEIAKEIGCSGVLENNAAWCNRFKVKSTSSNREYIISQRRSDGMWGCSCPGWINHNKGSHSFACKHLKVTLRLLSKVTIRRDSLAAKMLESARMAYLDLSEARPVVHNHYTPTGVVEI